MIFTELYQCTENNYDSDSFHDLVKLSIGYDENIRRTLPFIHLHTFLISLLILFTAATIKMSPE